MDTKYVGDRLTVVEQVIHQQFGEPASQFDSRYAIPCTTSDEVWDRKLMVGEEFQPLVSKHCWIEEPGMVIITNLAGNFTQVQPTDEERLEEESKVLSICANDEQVFYIPAQANMRFWPPTLTRFNIRCINGETKYKITVFPK
ncbi:hypothetical protein OAG36_00670 [bacterium]|nr:hypothetical protein [bacterium]